MEAVLDFARGPLFRFSLAVLVLGLLRILILDLWGIYTTYRRAGDKQIPWKLVVIRTFEWLVPVKRVAHQRPIYSILSILFHIGLLLVPIFLFAHVRLWELAIGFAWPTLPKIVADILTVSTVLTGILLFVGRVASKASSFISRKQDKLWPLVLIVPFTTGFVCANITTSLAVYNVSMLIHVLSAEMIFLLLPFTKIAHCILLPLSQLVSTVAWKFPAETDEDVCITLEKEGAPV